MKKQNIKNELYFSKNKDSSILFKKHKIKNKTFSIYPLEIYKNDVTYNPFFDRPVCFHPLYKFCLYAKNFILTEHQKRYLEMSKKERFEKFKFNTRLNNRIRIQIRIFDYYFDGMFVNYHHRFNYRLGVISLCLSFIRNGYDNNKFLLILEKTIKYDYISDIVHFRISLEAKKSIITYLRTKQEIPSTKYLNELYEIFQHDLEVERKNLESYKRPHKKWYYAGKKRIKGDYYMKREKPNHTNYSQRWDEIHTRKNTPEQTRKLKLIEDALENNILTYDVPISKFNKTYALTLYRRLTEINKKKSITELLYTKPDNYKLINNYSKLLETFEDLKQEELIAVDTETTGLEFEDRIVGISIYLTKKDYAIYIPTKHTTDEDQINFDLVYKKLKPIFESNKIKKILHNAKFDYHMLLKEGIKLNNIVLDTMIGMHILNENMKSYALKNLSNTILKIESDNFDELFGKDCKFNTIKLDVATVYACKDVDLTYKLYKWLVDKYNEKPLLWNAVDLEMKLLYKIIKMEDSGILVDQKALNKNAKLLDEQTTKIKQELQEELEINNINSTKQLGEALNRLNIFEHNEQSTSKQVLKKYKHKPIIQKILKYKKDAKILTTYYKPINKYIRQDNRLYTNFNQLTTVTGRLSSSKPNMQNIPKEARDMFIAPEGKVLISLDYKQQEVRYMANISEDKGLKEPFKQGIDLYSSIASQIYNIPIDECKDGTNYRKITKQCIIAIMYGMTPKVLSLTLNIPMFEVNKLLDKFKSSYPKMFEFISNTEKQVLKDGYVIIENTRYRNFRELKHNRDIINKINKKLLEELAYIPDNIYKVKSLTFGTKERYIKAHKEIKRIKRQSVNAIIQGGCAIITKKAIIAIDDLLELYGDDYKIISTIHDEILLEVPETITDEQVQELKNKMINVVNLDVKMLVDLAIMKVWQ